MNLLTINPYIKKHYDLIKKCEFLPVFESLLEKTTTLDEKQWNKIKKDSNEIQEYVVSENNGIIDNYCIYQGTKDNKMIQMIIGNLSQKTFLKKVEEYAFEKLDAQIITIILDDNYNLSKLGYECLGDYQGKTLYLKEKGMEKSERVKV